MTHNKKINNKDNFKSLIDSTTILGISNLASNIHNLVSSMYGQQSFC